MKKILLLIVFLTTALFAELEWADSYKKGMAKAKQEHKLVLVMLTQKECDACWYMENIVFKDDDIVDEIEKDFVSVRIDIQNDHVPENLSYAGTPTFHFLTAQGQKIDRFSGAMNIKDFRTKINEVKAKVKN